jgi:hypothetical protein
MLSIELLRMIQADRAREIAAADRVRLLHPDEPEPGVSGPQVQRAMARRSEPARRPHTHTGTGPTAATDPCV